MNKIIQIPKNVENVLKKLNIQNPKLLGKGGEGWIFAFENKALKVGITLNNNELWNKYGLNLF